jgi:hypothetical protein
MGNMCCRGCFRRLCPQRRVYTGIIIGRNLQLPELPTTSLDMEEEEEEEEGYTTNLPPQPSTSFASQQSFSRV